MKKRSELLFSLILVPIDFLMAMAGFAAAYVARVQYDVKPIAHQIPGRSFIALMLIVLPVWILIFALAGLYNLQSTRSKFAEIGRIFMATAGGVMFLILAEFVSPQAIFPSKAVPVYGFIFAFIFITTARLVVGSFQQYLFRFGIGRRSVLVIGKSTAARQLRDVLENERGYNLIKAEASPNTIDVSWLNSLQERQHIDEIVLAENNISDERQVAIINFANLHQITFRFVPSAAELYRSQVEIGVYVNFPVIELKQTPLDGWGRIVKRLLDLLISFTVLIILSPVLLIIIIIIKLTDRGPAFFAHKRISRAGQQIKVLKFRTMYQKYCGQDAVSSLQGFSNGDQLVAEFTKHQKVKNDPRVTPFGRFLRSTSLDELPQLFNVIKGDLSLVGPRPVTKEELNRYGDALPTFLAIKPGVTGLWQVSGRNETGYEERIRLDVYYVENWSLWLDLVILVKTIRIVINGRGAY